MGAQHRRDGGDALVVHLPQLVRSGSGGGEARLAGLLALPPFAHGAIIGVAGARDPPLNLLPLAFLGGFELAPFAIELRLPPRDRRELLPMPALHFFEIGFGAVERRPVRSRFRLRRL